MSKLTALLFLLLCLAAVANDHDGDRDRVERDFGSDRFAAGGNVAISKAVTGDLIAAGGSVSVEANIGGDAVLAGGNVRVTGNVAQGIYGAGGQVNIDGTVGRNVRAAGGQVNLGPKSEVAGNLTVGGGQVTLRGTVKGYVQAAGGRVLIDGPVTGDVEATSGHVELGPNARIGGKLRYASGDELVRDPAAQVTGAVERIAMRGGWPVPADVEHRVGRRGGWVWTMGLLVLAVVLAAALPNVYGHVANTLQTRFGMSVLMGFVMLICVPVAALLLLITIIGVPLGLLAIALYLILLLLGYVACGMSLGRWVLQRVKGDAPTTLWRITGAVLGVLAVSLLARIPWLGGWIAFIALLAGLGALALQFGRTRAAASPIAEGST